MRLIGLYAAAMLLSTQAVADDQAMSADANYRGYVVWEGCRKPAYPRASVRNEESGTVRLAFLIGADGTLLESKIVRSTGFRDLDNAAHLALRECRFRPAIENGKAVESWVQLEYRWSIARGGSALPGDS
jgi:TonB family protein